MSDTATRAAPAPASGMQRIPFPLESYEHPSLPLIAKHLLNLMAEKAPDDARVAAALVSTPGLVPFIPVGPGPILAMNDDQPGCIYVVSGVLAYRVSFDPDGSPTIEGIGNVGTPDAGTVAVEQLRHHRRRPDCGCHLQRAARLYLRPSARRHAEPNYRSGLSWRHIGLLCRWVFRILGAGG